jgi:hypothetical protein
MFAVASSQACYAEARGAESLPAAERVRALQECCTHILARLDKSKDSMDRYYHAFLQLEDVVSQTVNSQNELIKNVRALRCPRGSLEPALSGAADTTESDAADSTESGTRESKWRGVVCAHRQRRYTDTYTMPPCRLYRAGK